MSSHHYSIHGSVVRSENKIGVANVRVELWKKEFEIKDLISKKDFIKSIYTDGNGKFEMNFDIYLLLNRYPDFFFKVYQQVNQIDKLILDEEDNVWKDVHDGDHDATLKVDAALLPPLVSEKDIQKYVVSGRIINGYNEGISNKTVIAYDVDLKGAKIYKTAKTIVELDASGGMQVLGKTTSNPDGSYSISFKIDQYKSAERRLADVVVYAVTTNLINADAALPDILGRSKMTTNSDYINNEVKNWDVVLTNSVERGQSEYAKLMWAIEPFMKESGLQLFELYDSEDQIDFLASETEQDKTNTSIAVQAAKLSNDSKLSSELIYGVGRPYPKIDLDWKMLYIKSHDDLTGAINKSISSNYIFKQDDKAIAAFVIALSDAAFEFASKSNDNADLFKTLGFTIKEPALQKTFIQSYAQYKNQPQELWDDLSKKGFKSDVIQSLQLTNQLSILTGGNTALIEKLQLGRDISDPSDLLEIEPEEWQRIISKVKVSDNIPGNNDDEKRSSYISGINNMLNAAYPTKKIMLMIRSGDLHVNDDVRDKTVDFLQSDGAKDFDISTSRITDFSDAIEQVGGDLSDKVTQHLQLSQRLYQVSPTPEAMQVLNNKGYTSAYHISSISQNSFINMEAKDLGGIDVAFSVYNRARHQVMRAQHILSKVRDTQDQNIPSKIITRQQQQAIKDYINNL